MINLLSNVAFKFSLRRYTKAMAQGGVEEQFALRLLVPGTLVGRCRLDPIKPTLKAPITGHLKLKCDETP
jgi:hypothetical protein